MIEEKAGEALVLVQQQFYENNHSFIICEIQKPVEELLDKAELLELMNVTLSESEAWDIVQMEEIERELLGDEEIESRATDLLPCCIVESGRAQICVEASRELKFLAAVNHTLIEAGASNKYLSKRNDQKRNIRLCTTH